DEDDQEVARDHDPSKGVARPPPPDGEHRRAERQVDKQDEDGERGPFGGRDHMEDPAQGERDGGDGSPHDECGGDQPGPEVLPVLELSVPHPHLQFDAPCAKTCTSRGRLHRWPTVSSARPPASRTGTTKTPSAGSPTAR